MKLTSDQIQQFSELGYLHLPARYDAALLKQATEQANRLHQQAFELLKRNEVPKDFAFSHRYLQAFLNRLTQFHLYAGRESLACLGSPIILDIAKGLCGEAFLPSVDMLILKNQYDELDLPWHQDLIFDPKIHRVIAIGIYLEDACASDGALKLVKGSQHARQDIDQLMAQTDLEIIEVPAKAGDIVVHNPMLVHWSDSLKQQALRRTLYYEFRSLNQVIDQENWPQTIIDQRMGILNLAIDQHLKQYPDKRQFSPEPNKFDHHIDLNDLYRQPIPYSMANFAKSVLQRSHKNKS